MIVPAIWGPAVRAIANRPCIGLGVCEGYEATTEFLGPECIRTRTPPQVEREPQLVLGGTDEGGFRISHYYCQNV